mgnify:CR=1 FL=1
MKTLIAACLLLASTSAWSQEAPPCPTLPASAGLQWEQRVDTTFIACKAVTADGRQVLNVMLTSRDPRISLERRLREEFGFPGTPVMVAIRVKERDKENG